LIKISYQLIKNKYFILSVNTCCFALWQGLPKRKLFMNETKQKLIVAEQKAKDLFSAVEDRGLIVPGKSERELAEEIVALAASRFGISDYWHKKIVRVGANTLHPYNGDPADQIIQEDDILFLDFGPVFEGWEADLGRTYVIGNDPLKWKLKADVEAAWQEVNAWYGRQRSLAGTASLTGAACFSYVAGVAKRYGWEFGGEIAGHIVGPFPHEQPESGGWGLDIHPDNHEDILQPDKHGNSRHWILEIQFVDKVKKIGGFFEQLLN
jgi:Xaa-Pro aminopeptidase